MKAHVDPDLCGGCGPCEDICPAVFRIEHDVAEVIVSEVPAGEEEACRQAAEECPTDAITIEE